jgi:hypothetical protein
MFTVLEIDGPTVERVRPERQRRAPQVYSPDNSQSHNGTEIEKEPVNTNSAEQNSDDIPGLFFSLVICFFFCHSVFASEIIKNNTENRKAEIAKLAEKAGGDVEPAEGLQGFFGPPPQLTLQDLPEPSPKKSVGRPTKKIIYSRKIVCLFVVVL